MEKKHSPMKAVQQSMLRIFVVILLGYVLFWCVMGFMLATNNDMYPRIDAGDIVFYYRLNKGNIKAQDVVVLNKNDTTYLGRVVACSGDVVEIGDDQRLRINGSVMIENNIFYQTPAYEGFVEYPVTLGENEFFVLCDYRNGGEDSRYYGVVNVDDIVGTVINVLKRNGI